MLTNAESSVRSFLMWFQGKQGLFKKAWILGFHFEDLLKSWSLKKRENMESFISYQGDGDEFDPTMILKVLDMMKSNPNVPGMEGMMLEDWERERFYPYNSIITEHYNFPQDIFDCQDGIDIIRVSNGKRAILKISPKHFMFFVWL